MAHAAPQPKRRRWKIWAILAIALLLIFGAIVNVLVMAAFTVAARMGRATVDNLSVTSKVAQVALEVLLLWLILQPAQGTIELS